MSGRSRLAAFVAATVSLMFAAFRFDGAAEAAVRPPSASSAGEAREAGRTASQADSVLGVFEGRTPCGPVAHDFTGFPSSPDCEKIKWRITLHRHPVTRQPTTWVFKGTKTAREGRWRIQRNAGPDNRWTVYHLDHGGAGKVFSLLSVDDEVLVFLDRDLRVLPGDAAYSYVLNRLDKPAR